MGSLQKRGIYLIVALCLLGSAAIAADDPIKPRLVIFTALTSAPKTFVKDDKATGYGNDITAEAVRRAGYTPDIQAIPWARAVKSAEQAEGLITLFSRSPERDKLFNFSEVIFKDPVLLVTRRDADFPFNGLKDLAGRTVGILRGASYGPALEVALPTFKDDRDDSAAQRLRKLLEGRIDGAILAGGRPSIYYNARAIGIDSKQLVIKDVPISMDPTYIGILRTYPNGAEIMNRLNKAIKSMWADGTITKILASYE